MRTTSRFRSLALLLSPIPFLIGMAMVLAAFWQNDADFALGRAVSVDAVMVDGGPPHPSRGRPRYFPTFRLVDGQLLTLERAMVAAELPATGQPTQLLCSTRRPGNCRLPANPGMDRVFYGAAAVWCVLSIGIAGVVWGPFLRRWWRKVYSHAPLRQHSSP
jgi:hypothetical protein